MDHVTVWIALDEATPENGCMNVVPGAHKDGIMGHEAAAYDTDIVIADREFTREDAVALPMEPGDALFQHCLLPHFTAPNTTDRWRRALIMSYMDSRSHFTQSDEERPDWVDSVPSRARSSPGACSEGSGHGSATYSSIEKTICPSRILMMTFDPILTSYGSMCRSPSIRARLGT